jgi:hypothetical protein
MLGMMQRAFYGTPRDDSGIADLGAREALLLAVLAALLVLLGMRPQPALERARPALEQLVAREVLFDPADPDLAPGRLRTAAGGGEKAPGRNGAGGRP